MPNSILTFCSCPGDATVTLLFSLLRLIVPSIRSMKLTTQPLPLMCQTFGDILWSIACEAKTPPKSGIKYHLFFMLAKILLDNSPTLRAFFVESRDLRGPRKVWKFMLPPSNSWNAGSRLWTAQPPLQHFFAMDLSFVQFLWSHQTPISVSDGL